MKGTDLTEKEFPNWLICRLTDILSNDVHDCFRDFMPWKWLPSSCLRLLFLWQVWFRIMFKIQSTLHNGISLNRILHLMEYHCKVPIFCPEDALYKTLHKRIKLFLIVNVFLIFSSLLRNKWLIFPTVHPWKIPTSPLPSPTLSLCGNWGVNIGCRCGDEACPFQVEVEASSPGAVNWGCNQQICSLPELTIAVLSAHQEEKKMQTELARQFGISQPQVSTIIKDKEALEVEYKKNGNQSRKRKRESKAGDVDWALWLWFEQMQLKGQLINGEN